MKLPTSGPIQSEYQDPSNFYKVKERTGESPIGVNYKDEVTNNEGKPVQSEPEEELRITKLEDPDGLIKKAKNYKGFPIKRSRLPMAIVCHWTAAPGQKMFDENFNNFSTIKWMIFTRDTPASYNMAISETGEIIEMVDPEYIAFHCGSTEYTKFANKFFGETICPSYKHTKDHMHPTSPNLVTIGICMAHKDWEGRMTDECYKSAVKAFAYCFNRYANHLDTYNSLIRHSDITPLKKIPCPRWFFDHPDDFHKFIDDVHKQRLEWRKKYERGYPTINYKIVRVEK